MEDVTRIVISAARCSGFIGRQTRSVVEPYM